MLVLFETSAGYALFKVVDEKKLQSPENLWKDFETPEAASSFLKLKSFSRFKDSKASLEAASALVESKIGKSLKKFLKKCVVPDVQEQLAVADAKVGSLIKDKLSIQCVHNSAVQELMRCMRSQLDSLIADLGRKERVASDLGLAHSLSRYKLKFSPEKIDTMIIQAVSLLDDLDKELNNYVMRCREWYGWHFPEIGKLVQDHLAFAKTVKLIGMKENALTMDLSSVLPADLAEQVMQAAVISMGTEISEADVTSIHALCDQIIELTDYRSQLSDYLKNRMIALAPNVTALLGELVSARLISHAGSLMNLAKSPASTVQILGAEKALFRALKTKRDTPKYGLIYHAQLIGGAPGKLKGKMSRMLAAKAALACRVDALGEDHSAELGIQHRAYLEQKLNNLQNHGTKKISGLGKLKSKFEKHQFKSDVETYDEAADSTMQGKKRHADPLDGPPSAKKKKVKLEPVDPEPEQPAAASDDEVEATVVKKKKKKKVKEEEEEPETNGESEETPKKKKKKKAAD